MLRATSATGADDACVKTSPPLVVRVFLKSLACGVFREGVTGLRCPDGGHDVLVYPMAAVDHSSLETNKLTWGQLLNAAGPCVCPSGRPCFSATSGRDGFRGYQNLALEAWGRIIEGRRGPVFVR